MISSREFVILNEKGNEGIYFGWTDDTK